MDEREKRDVLLWLLNDGEAVTTQAGVDELEDAGIIDHVPVVVISEAEAEEADCVVCTWLPPERRAMACVETTCHDCGRDIIHSTTVPKKPMKICVSCAIARAQGGNA